MPITYLDDEPQAKAGRITYLDDKPQFEDLSRNVPLRLNPDVGRLPLPEQLTTYGGPPKPLASYPETMASLQGGGPISDIVAPRPSLTEGRYNPPRIEVNKGDSFLTGAATEAVNTLNSVPSFFTSDAGILALLAGKLSPRLVAAGFSADLTHSAFSQAQEAAKNWDTLTPGQKGQAVVGVLSSALFGIGAGAHAAGVKLRAKAEPQPEGPLATGEVLTPRAGAPAPKPEFPASEPLTKEGAQNANSQQIPISTVRSEASRVAGAVAEGEPGAVQLPAGEGKAAEAQTQAKEVVAAPQPPAQQAAAEVAPTPAVETKRQALWEFPFKPDPKYPRLDQLHIDAITQAIKEGKPVPQNVVDSLPDWAKPKTSVEPPAAVVPPEAAAPAAPVVPAEAAPVVEPPKAIVPPSAPIPRDWDAFYENLTDELDSFNPARHSGKINYDLNDMADRFIEYAKADKTGKPVDELVREFADSDTASKSQIKKLRDSVKNIQLKEQKSEAPPVSLPQEAPPTAPAKGEAVRGVTAPPEPAVATAKPKRYGAAGMTDSGDIWVETFDTKDAAETVYSRARLGGNKKLAYFDGRKFKTVGDIQQALNRQWKPVERKNLIELQREKMQLETERANKFEADEKVRQEEQDKTAESVIAALQEVTGEKDAKTGIASGRGGNIWDEVVDQKFTQEQLSAARSWLIRNGVSDTRLLRAVEGARPIKPIAATTPVAAAVQKVEKQVESVARTESQRPAKEVKSELVQRLESAVSEAPFTTSEYFGGLYVHEAKTLNETTRISDRAGDGGIPLENWLDRKKTKSSTELNRETMMGAKFIAEALEKKGVKKVTIDIPGDGSFTVWNTKDAIQGVLDRAKKISTKPIEPTKVSKSGTSKEDREWIEKTLANPEKAPPTTPTPPIVGMGGAVPGEFSGTGDFVSNMFAAIDRDRTAMGKEPMPETRTRTWDEDNQRALSRMNRDPNWIPDLLNEVEKQPRPLLSWENAGLVWQRAHWKAEYNNSLQRIARAFEDGREADLSAAKAEAGSFEGKLDRLDRIVGRGGTGSEAGRSLNAQKMAAGNDFTLVELVLQKRAALGGRQLTAEEVSDLKTKVDEHARLAAELKQNLEESEKRNAELNVKLALADVEKTKSTVEPHIRVLADRIKNYFDQRADKALKELRSATWSVGPELLLKLTDVGVSRILARGIDVGEMSAVWVKDMTELLGERVIPHLKDIWESSKKKLDEVSERISGGKGSQAEKVKRTVKGTDINERKEAVTDKIKGKVESDQLDQVQPLVQQLAKIFSEQGVRGWRPLTDAVHNVLKDIIPGLDYRDTMDAISGHGKFRIPDQAEAARDLRDSKAQINEIRKIQEVIARQPVKPTGFKRDLPSDIQRRLTQIYENAKRRFGVVVTDPAIQLRSALQARKSYYEHRLSDLQAEINARKRTVKVKAAPPTDAALESLIAEYETIKKRHEEVFGKRELTDAQKAEREVKSLDRQIAEVERQIKEGDIFPGTPKPRITSSEIESRRTQLDALKSEREFLRESIQPSEKFTDAYRLAAIKANMLRRTADLSDKLARGDFAKAPRRTPPAMDSEALRIRFNMHTIERQIREGRAAAERQTQSAGKKGLRYAGEVINAFRAMKTSFDLSAVLRQGGFIAFGHPIRALKSFPDMLKAFGSEKGQFAAAEEIRNRPNAPLYEQSKLYLAEHGGRLSSMEEAYMSRWSEKIPGVRASGRAYVTFLNKLRADSFDAMASSLSARGNLTLPESRVISNYINVATGRGSVALDQAAVALNTAFFAPRYVASRFQLLSGQPLWGGGPLKGSGAARILIAKEYARFLAGASVVYALGVASGATIGTDPRSSDFGKMRFGNTRVDPMAGLIQISVLLSRLASGKTKDSKGHVYPIRGKVPFGKNDAADFIWQFIRSKFSPAVGESLNIVTGKDVVYQKVTPASIPGRLLAPIGLVDIYQAMRSEGIPEGSALAILSIFGMGLQTYGKQTQ